MKQLPLSNEGALPWWHALCALAALNVCAWLGIWLFGPARDTYSTLQLTLSGAYVFVCAYRSILPRVDLERRVVVDSVVSSIFLGRSAATIAEVCFGVQLGLLIYELGAYAGLPGVQETAWVVTLCTVLAQGFCWHSILTLNHITQAVESLLWALGFSWMTALLIVVAMDTGARWRARAFDLRRLCIVLRRTALPAALQQGQGARPALPERPAGPAGCLVSPRAGPQLG